MKSNKIQPDYEVFDLRSIADADARRQARWQLRLDGIIEGREARNNNMKLTECWHSKGSSVRKWWIKGWRRQDAKIKAEKKRLTEAREVASGVFYIPSQSTPSQRKQGANRVASSHTHLQSNLNRIYRNR